MDRAKLIFEAEMENLIAQKEARKGKIPIPDAFYWREVSDSLLKDVMSDRGSGAGPYNVTLIEPKPMIVWR